MSNGMTITVHAMQARTSLESVDLGIHMKGERGEGQKMGGNGTRFEPTNPPSELPAFPPSCESPLLRQTGRNRVAQGCKMSQRTFAGAARMRDIERNVTNARRTASKTTRVTARTACGARYRPWNSGF